jgi:hypothetical protein
MSSNRNTVVRSMHDIGAAAWFGGSLMGAVALNGATTDIGDPPTARGLHPTDGPAGRQSTPPRSARTSSAA